MPDSWILSISAHPAQKIDASSQAGRFLADRAESQHAASQAGRFLADRAESQPAPSQPAQSASARLKRMEDAVANALNNPPPVQNPGSAQSPKKESRKREKKGKKKSAPFPFPTDFSFLNFVVRFIIL